MAARPLSLKKYLLAFLLTIIIFSGGVLLGLFLENARLQDTKQITLQDKVNLRSLQLQQSYIKSGSADCSSLNQLLENNIDELGQKMALIMDYEKNAFFSQEEFNLELRDYFLTEIQFLLLSREIDQKCQKGNVKIIYFYSEDETDTQGDILDYIKKIFGSKVLVFSLNSAFAQEPMISLLLNSYKIDLFPAVVIEERVFQGHTPLETLKKAVCEEFRKIGETLPEPCKS